MTVPVRDGPDGNGTASIAVRARTARCEPAAPPPPVGAPSGSVPTKTRQPVPGRQKGPEWAADYRATCPKVERKLGHLMRRRHGGRRARVRGRTKVDADFNLLAVATNLARLAVLGLRSTPSGWTVAKA